MESPAYCWRTIHISIFVLCVTKSFSIQRERERIKEAVSRLRHIATDCYRLKTRCTLQFKLFFFFVSKILVSNELRSMGSILFVCLRGWPPPSFKRRLPFFYSRIVLLLCLSMRWRAAISNSGSRRRREITWSAHLARWGMAWPNLDRLLWLSIFVGGSD